jgi:hypothetical protein
MSWLFEVVWMTGIGCFWHLLAMLEQFLHILRLNMVE